MKHTTLTPPPLKSLNIAIVSAILGLGAVSTVQAQSANGKLTTKGQDAVVAGKLNQASGDLSTISGGTYNNAKGDLSTISGGAANRVEKNYSSIGGGGYNHATGENSTVAGGFRNEATGENSTVAGGYFNKATGVGSFATGVSNHATGGMSTVSGGGANQATGGQSSIGGGVSNEATGANSTVAGGYMNKAIGEKSTIAGGSHNEATGKGSFAAGVNNKANTENAVAVGNKNIIEGTNSAAIGSNNTVAEGQKDVFILGSNTTNAQSGSVLLGNKTSGKKATAVSSATVDGLNLTGFAGASKPENGVVSVGSKGGERQIVNVGAGNISADSTDAVNGSQLHALATDVANNIDNIHELAQQQDQHGSDIKTLAKASAANKADADASFETLTKNQNTLIEKDEEHDRLIAQNQADIANNINNIYELAQQQDQHGSDIKTLAKASAANKADADAKFKGVQTDIANNKITLANHAKKINDNQKAIEAKLGGKVDAQKLVDLETKVDDGLKTVQENYSQLNTQVQSVDNKIGMVDTRVNALDDKVENSMAAQAALNGLFQPYNVGKVSVSAAVGAYGSKSAIAVGAGYRVNPHLAFKGGAAINTSGSRKGSYNLGINYEF